MRDAADTETSNSASNRELIILAAPGADGYYTAVQDEIVDFHVRYAQAVAKADDVIVLTGPALHSRYVKALGDDHVALAPMSDIWMRDFSPLNAAAPIMMRYSAAGQGGGRKGQGEAGHVQDQLVRLIDAADVSGPESDFINDGGNFVDDYAGRVVLSRKFLRDNRLSEDDGRAAIKDITGAEHVAFIEADEQGGLEHADGVVAFVGPNTLVVNSYPEDPEYAAQLHADLRAGLPDVKIHEIITPYDGREIFDAQFGSACGLYTNMLVTPARIYFPQFGMAEDAVALSQLRDWTDRDIIPVPSAQICQMGGGVRCMSWQLRGDAAQRLKTYLRSL
ncbi:MAG: agmatine deiminase family protein [Litorimonas sp.]